MTNRQQRTPEPCKGCTDPNQCYTPCEPMTARTPHPLRCETCGHWKKRRPRSRINTCEILNNGNMTVIPIGESQITALVGCASHTSAPAAEAQQRIERVMDTLKDLKACQGLLYEFCEWFCDYDCEEKPCKLTVSQLHERLEGIEKQMKAHPEYLKKWNIKRSEQIALLRGEEK